VNYLKWTLVLICCGLFLIFDNVLAFEAFTIEKIRLEGIRRIASGTVYNYLPVKVGERFDQDKASQAISALFKTGFFQDIRLRREDNDLIIQVVERPAIYAIEIKGNEDITTEELMRALKHIGLQSGRVFNRSLLEKMELELKRQYFSRGKYGVTIKTTITPISRNRVTITLDISEGLIARIHQITLVGNQSFSDQELRDEMALSTKHWFSFFSSSDQYSKQKLAADLESLRTFYQDRGYINFNTDSTQVTISPDKKDVYITINFTEGDKYTVSQVKIVGHTVVSEQELVDKIKIKAGDLFSSKQITLSTDALLERLGEEGYAFAHINAVPEIDPENKTVALTFFIDQGKRIYVRRINFKGNTITRDEVLRREMRQMEGAWISTKQVKRSQTRLKRLGYFEDVEFETTLVPGTTDQIDINYTVVERPSGNIMAGIGYSQMQGVLFNANLIQDNFLGSGKRVGLTFNNNQINTTYRFSYHNPYATIDGISRGFSLFYRTTDAEEANLSRYTSDVYGANLNYGIPLSEYNRFYLGGAFDHTKLKTTSLSAEEVFQFIEDHGDTYRSYRLTSSWAYDSRNRYLFPDRGTLQSFFAEVALPFSDLDYYKVGYNHEWLYPLTKDFILLLKGNLAYGDGYGDDDDLPFFENYTAGGTRSVRGFRGNTLGPLDSRGRPYGGNLKVVGNAEMILPPFFKKQRELRFSLFLDAGNVYGVDEEFDSSQLRYSAGISAIWLSPIGMFNFSFAKPLNPKEGDQVQTFQFTIGTTF
jgi:outer membrane protein insertion porin family